MGKKSGRLMELWWKGDKVATLRSKSITFENNAIEVDTDDDEGVRVLLECDDELVVSSRAINISAGGLSSDDVFLDAAATGEGLYGDMKIVFPGRAEVEGKFALTSYTEDGEYQDAITFSCDIQSSGQWTRTKI